MNKISICENFKNENLPLIFNVNYEGKHNLNDNDDYLYILDRFFTSLDETISIYEFVKCIITIFSLDEESNLNLNIYDEKAKVFELHLKDNNVMASFMKTIKGNSISALSNDGKIFTYDLKNFFKVDGEPFCFKHLEEYGTVANDFLHIQLLEPFELDYDIKMYIKLFTQVTGTYPYFDDEIVNTNSLMLYLMHYYHYLKYDDEVKYLFEMVNKYLYLFGKIDISDMPRLYNFREYELGKYLIPNYMKKSLSKTSLQRK